MQGWIINNGASFNVTKDNNDQSLNNSTSNVKLNLANHGNQARRGYRPLTTAGTGGRPGKRESRQASKNNEND